MLGDEGGSVRPARGTCRAQKPQYLSPQALRRAGCLRLAMGRFEDRHRCHTFTLQWKFGRTAKGDTESFRRLCALGCLLVNYMDTAQAPQKMDERFPFA